MAQITCKLTHDEMTNIIRQHLNLPNEAIVEILPNTVELVDTSGWTQVYPEYDSCLPPASASKHTLIEVQFENGTIGVGSPHD